MCFILFFGSCRWSLIAGRIPGRTDNEIKNYWNTHLSKKLISQGIDPRTHKPLNPNSSPDIQAPASKDSKPNLNPNPNSTEGNGAIIGMNMDRDHGRAVVDGDKTWRNSDGLMMSSQGCSKDDAVIDYCPDDVFSSFLNSLINEDVFGHQHQQPQPIEIAPFYPLVSSAQTLGYGAIWEAALTSSMAAPSNEEEPKRFVDHVNKRF